MFLGELSDMVGLEYQRSQDSDPFFILVMQIATGKLLLLSSFLLLVVVVSCSPNCS
jgi:hypothetical protein